MIAIRSIVEFVHKNRDNGKYIVRELRCNGKALIESIDGVFHLLVDVDDLMEVDEDEY